MMDLLAEAGIGADDVTDIILTHLHFDHTGFISRFPAARIHLQRAEMVAALTGAADHAALRWTYEAQDIQALIAASFEGRVTLYDGDAELFPGIGMLLCRATAPASQR